VDVALGFRGSRDFGSVDDYRQFLARLLCGRNATRRPAWAEERETLRPVPDGGLPDRIEEDRRVDPGSLVTVDNHVYSVPPSYIGEELRCRVGWGRIEFWHGVTPVRDVARVWGEGQGVEWRDLVVALSRKPGAFAAYRYRDAFFPSAELRSLYGQLEAARGPEQADREWLALLVAVRHVPDDRLAAIVRCVLNASLASVAIPESASRAVG
jgi:hypothetical protein